MDRSAGTTTRASMIRSKEEVAHAKAMAQLLPHAGAWRAGAVRGRCRRRGRLMRPTTRIRPASSRSSRSARRSWPWTRSATPSCTTIRRGEAPDCEGLEACWGFSARGAAGVVVIEGGDVVAVDVASGRVFVEERGAVTTRRWRRWCRALALCALVLTAAPATIARGDEPADDGGEDPPGATDRVVKIGPQAVVIVDELGNVRMWDDDPSQQALACKSARLAGVGRCRSSPASPSPPTKTSPRAPRARSAIDSRGQSAAPASPASAAASRAGVHAEVDIPARSGRPRRARAR